MKHLPSFLKVSCATFSLTAMTTVLLGGTLVLTGCQSTNSLFDKRDDGSLNYQKSKKLAPLTLPADQQTAPFVPLYPTPTVGTNTLQLTNEAGKQFKLPPPERSVSVTPAN